MFVSLSKNMLFYLHHFAKVVGHNLEGLCISATANGYILLVRKQYRRAGAHYYVLHKKEQLVCFALTTSQLFSSLFFPWRSSVVVCSLTLSSLEGLNQPPSSGFSPVDFYRGVNVIGIREMHV